MKRLLPLFLIATSHSGAGSCKALNLQSRNGVNCEKVKTVISEKVSEPLSRFSHSQRPEDVTQAATLLYHLSETSDLTYGCLTDEFGRAWTALFESFDSVVTHSPLSGRMSLSPIPLAPGESEAAHKALEEQNRQWLAASNKRTALLNAEPLLLRYFELFIRRASISNRSAIAPVAKQILDDPGLSQQRREKLRPVLDENAK